VPQATCAESLRLPRHAPGSTFSCLGKFHSITTHRERWMLCRCCIVQAIVQGKPCPLLSSFRLSSHRFVDSQQET